MRNVTRVLLGLAVVGLVVGQGPGVAAAPAVPDPGALDNVSVVADFPMISQYGSFAESMAPDGRGGMIVSVTTWGVDDASSPSGYSSNVGQLWRVQPGESKEKFGPEIDLTDCGMLTGVAVDRHGRVFVNVDNYAAEYADYEGLCTSGSGAEFPASGVYRVTQTGYTPWMTLPAIAFPNGLAVHDGSLFVSDSLNGSIWNGPTATPTAPQQPWYASELLLPVDGIGVNGITVGKGALYATSYDRGLVLRIPLGQGGGQGLAKVVAQDDALVASDGIALDRTGQLWVAVAEGSLVVVEPNGRVVAAEVEDGSLDYPTDVVLGDRGTVFVSNGSFMFGTPNVVAFTR